MADPPDYINGKPCGSFCRYYLGLPPYQPPVASTSVTRAAIAPKDLAKKSEPRRATERNTKSRNNDLTRRASASPANPLPDPLPKLITSKQRATLAGIESRRPNNKPDPKSPIAEPAVRVELDKQPLSSDEKVKKGVQHSLSTSDIAGRQDMTQPQQKHDQGGSPETGSVIEALGGSPKQSPETPKDNIAVAELDAGSPNDRTSSLPIPLPESRTSAPHEQLAALPSSQNSNLFLSPPSQTIAYRWIAIVMARPDISSLAELSEKNIAVDDDQVVTNDDMVSALSASGAKGVLLNRSSSKAINRLLGEEVSAAVLDVVSEESAERFGSMNFAGYPIFKIPLTKEMVSK